MWKQLAELFTGVFTLTHRLDKLEQAVKEQQREMKELTALVNRLAFELARTNEAQRHGQEREAGEREKFMLRVENQLLKAGRQLPPASPPGAEP
jgi:septal ring factor EnvC (AmiA/AmiB activator)